MKKITVFVCILVFSLFSAVVAAEINHFCKTECLGKGHFIGYCNSLCSAEDDAGKKTKDDDCVSSCLNKGYTSYNCYQECSAPDSK